MDPSLAVELLREYPQLLAVVAIVAETARIYQSRLTWSEFVPIHRFKRGVFPVVDRYAGDAILWVSAKGGRDDAEYEQTAVGTVRDTVRVLRDAGASLHVLSSLKRRPADFADGDPTGDTLTSAHVVWTIGEDQVEGYLFRNHNGTVDIYCHTEASVDDPLAHLTGGQTDGDAYGVLPVVGEKESATKWRAESDAHPAASRRRRRSRARRASAVPAAGRVRIPRRVSPQATGGR